MIVYDLDGTLRDTTPAEDFIPEDPSKQENWIPWQSAANLAGTPIADVVEQYKKDCAGTASVWIVTNSSFGTRQWLIDHNLPLPNKVFEREKGDNRSPATLKKGFLAAHGDVITKWVDDNEEMCDYVNEHYFHITVYQVTPSNEHKSEEEQGMKFDDEKPRYDLLPPRAIDTMCKVLTFGARKYSPDNWKLVERTRYVAAALRHIFALLRGETYDSETGLHHGAHAMCCLSFIVEKDETKKLE